MENIDGKLIYRENLTDDLAIFRFSRVDNSPIDGFKPGQFVSLGLKIDENEITHRTYSIASSPSENNFYEFYIKHKEHPTLGKFTTALFNLNIGDPVFLQSPRGSFTIEDEINGIQDTRNMVLVCSGTGLAPFMSYIRYLKNSGNKRRVILLHGVSFVQELGYRTLLEKLTSEPTLFDFVYVPTVSRLSDNFSENWKGCTGRVETLLSGIENHDSKIEQILNEHLTIDNSIFYLCGYKNMISDVISLLSPLGFVDNRHKKKDGSFDIKYELYGI